MVADIKLSPEFKSQTTKAVISIALFIIVYLLLIVMAIGLTIFCAYVGFTMIVTYPRFITILLGIGLGSLGFLVLIFLIKFIFKSHKIDRSHLTEIKRKDEPQLFALIDSIVKQVDTTFPKKVYLSADVNASVFYDSSFWSMFLPVRKNLQIGLGLVNSVSEEEFKSILAHEFGHFSQETMKVGSYVYNVNQVIYNMLYDNDGYDQLISGWASISGFIAIFAIAAVKIIEFIQWVLRKMYGLINLSYMGLSREMEFHADEIAANVTGYEPLKNSLLRLELANISYNSVIGFYETKISDNIKSGNLFEEQSFVMNYLAKDSAIPIQNNLPQVTIAELNKFNKSKLVIKDQWASHPSTEDRIKRLESLELPPPKEGYAPANTIFKDIAKTQKKLTDKIFSAVFDAKKAEPLSFPDFQQNFLQQYQNNSFAKLYNGYYDDKNPTVFDPKSIELGADSKEISFNDLFSKQKVDLVYTAICLEKDMEVLQQIADKQIAIKTFDYDGKKYKSKASGKLVEQLKQELDSINEQIKQNDLEVFKYFLSIEGKGNEGLLAEKYTRFFDYEEEFRQKYGLYIALSDSLQFVSYTFEIDDIKYKFRQIEPMEVKLKNRIAELLEDELLQEEITKEMKETFELYASKKWTYVGAETYFENNLQVLFNTMNNYAFLLSRKYFLLKKEVLQYQKGLFEVQTSNG